MLKALLNLCRVFFSLSCFYIRRGMLKSEETCIGERDTKKARILKESLLGSHLRDYSEGLHPQRGQKQAEREAD